MISICKWGQKGIWILFPAWLRWMLTGDGWKECWPCGLAFKAVLRSRHLSSLPCVDVTTLLELELIHKDPCLTPNFILQQLFFSSFFFSLDSAVHGCMSLGNHFYHDSVPHENDVICIFIELLHLMPILLDLVTQRYLTGSGARQPPVWVTCKYKSKADCYFLNHILYHDWLGLQRWYYSRWSWKLKPAADTAWQHLKNLFDKWTMMQICTFGDAYPCRLMSAGAHWIAFCCLLPHFQAFQPFFFSFNFERLTCHFFPSSPRA